SVLCSLFFFASILIVFLFCLFFFFFQAEDGIRDDLVTGVQTCALPIFVASSSSMTAGPETMFSQRRRARSSTRHGVNPPVSLNRSEERRVGKECRSRWCPDKQIKNKDTQGNYTSIEQTSKATTSPICNE